MENSKLKIRSYCKKTFLMCTELFDFFQRCQSHTHSQTSPHKELWIFQINYDRKNACNMPKLHQLLFSFL